MRRRKVLFFDNLSLFVLIINWYWKPCGWLQLSATMRPQI